MAKTITRMAVSFAVLALAACGAANPDRAEPGSAEEVQSAVNQESNPDVVIAGEARSTKAASAKLAYIVSQHSPLLSEAQKITISQDFNGAPLSGPPKIHTVRAQRVSCRARAPSVGAGVVCSITYNEAHAVEIGAPDAKDLFDALGAAGVEDEGGMSHLERSITALSCTVDDNVAQTTPGTGDKLAGFACQFSVQS